jgi:hypothetical protein
MKPHTKSKKLVNGSFERRAQHQTGERQFAQVNEGPAKVFLRCYGAGRIPRNLLRGQTRPAACRGRKGQVDSG